MAKFRTRSRTEVRVWTVILIAGLAVLIWQISLWAGVGTLVGDNVELSQMGHTHRMDRALTGTPGKHDGDSQPREIAQESYNDMHFQSRQLLHVLDNCTPPAIEQFPEPIFDAEQRKHGAVAFHIFLSLYMFVALALVCDDYFVPACESICTALRMKSDVAGATFMAAGSSAPELATAVIGVFVAKDDIGVGSVVGSAVFNIMFVISICALFAGAIVYLSWWPMLRDSLFYTISIIALVLVILDEEVHWWEALILLILYALYILLMCFNDKLEALIVPRVTWLGKAGTSEESTLIKAKKTQSLQDSVLSSESDCDNPAADGSTELETLLPSIAMENGILDDLVKSLEDEDDDEDTSPLSFPDSWFKRIVWILCLPLILLLFITIPDCRKERWKRWFLVTFTMSIIWIAAFSYIMVWMITVVGFTFGIPDTVMGLTFIAAGASVPDAFASLLVARDGLGDMAVSNAIGSNNFDILLCLGLPWFLQTAVVDPNSTVQVYSAGLTYSGLTLLTTVVLLILITHINGWKMNKKYGVVLMLIYVAFMVLAILYELNVFGYVHPPTCPSNY